MSGASTGPCPPLPASPSHRWAPWNQGWGVSAGPAWLEGASPWGPSILLPDAATPAHLPDATDPMVLWWFSCSLGSPQPALSAALGWDVPFFVYGLCDCQRLSCYPPLPGVGMSSFRSFHPLSSLGSCPYRRSYSSGFSQRGKSLSWSVARRWHYEFGDITVPRPVAVGQAPNGSNCSYLQQGLGSCLKNTVNVTHQELWR